MIGRCLQPPGNQGRARRLERGPALPFPFIINSNFDAGLELEFECEPELEQEFGVFEHEMINYDLVWSLAAGANRGKWRYCPYPYSNQNPVFIGQGWPAQSYPIGSPYGRHSVEHARVIVIKIFGTINDPGTRVSNRLEVRDDFFLITQAQMEFFFSRLFQDIDADLMRCIRQCQAALSRIQLKRPRPARHSASTLWGGRHSVSILDYSSVPGRRGGQGGLE